MVDIVSGKQEDIKRLGPGERILRLGIGLALVVFASLAGLAGIYLLVAGLGVVIMFMAVYDRCPIYRMVSTRLKEILKRRSTQP